MMMVKSFARNVITLALLALAQASEHALLAIKIINELKCLVKNINVYVKLVFMMMVRVLVVFHAIIAV